MRERHARAQQTDRPLPPARLRFRVSATTDEATYLKAGETLAQDIKNLCKIAGRDLYSFTDVLDFGCGCGRVIQNFGDRPETCKLYGTDIDSDLVGWCKKNLASIEWRVNGHRPPLPFDDDSFDLIYAISVFTHLDEDFQHAWLRELHRVAMPGATVILTVHGEHIIGKMGKLDRSYADEVHKRGLMYLTGPTGKLKVDGFPDFYQTTFHTKDYIYSTWSKYFDILDYVERGIDNYQDAVVLRSR